MKEIKWGRRKWVLGLILMIASAGLTSVGQAFWKLATNGLASWQLYLGFCLYGCGAIGMTLAFRYGSFAALHPLLSLGYIFSIFIGSVWLHEMITWKLLIGDGAILIGAICLGVGENQDRQVEVRSE